MVIDLTPVGIAGAGALALSLFLEYFPGFAPWYETLDKQWKALVAIGLTVLVGFGLAGWSCLNAQTCYYNSLEGLVQLVGIIALSLGLSGGVYQHIKKENFGDVTDDGRR